MLIRRNAGVHGQKKVGNHCCICHSSNYYQKKAISPNQFQGLALKINLKNRGVENEIK